MLSNRTSQLELLVATVRDCPLPFERPVEVRPFAIAGLETIMNRKQASEFDQELLDLYDDYAHGRIDRRGFLEGAAKFAVGGLTAEALLATLSPNYAWAQQVAKDDPRLKTEYVEYASPKGAGKMRGYLVRPAAAQGKLPAVVVIHENRGLNPYIEDVTRRLGIAGFLAFAPDALTPLGGYPGNDDRGRELQSKRDSEEMTQDFIAAAELLQKHALSNGKVGVVGFCFGGGIANALAVRIPDVIVAAVPFLRPAAGDRGCAEDQGVALAALRRTRPTRERRLAGLRAGPEGGQGAVPGAPLPRREPRLSQRHDAAL